MRTSIYPINKGVNQPLQFKGIKAQYIGYLGAVAVFLLLLFAILYLLGLPSLLCLGSIFGFGLLCFFRIHKLSHLHGEFGWMKVQAAKKIPKVLKSGSRQIFIFNKI